MAGIAERQRIPMRGMYALVERFILRRAGRVISVDSEAAGLYLRLYPWLSGRLEVIPNAVDTDLFRIEERKVHKSRWGFDGPTLLYAGRIEREKRVPELIRAFRTVGKAGVYLAIAGEGKERSAAEKAAEGLNVQFLGNVSRQEMPSLMNAADALVMYSTREGLPSAALEALACGTPVIATPVGALPMVVQDGRNGFLISSFSDLCSAMTSIIKGYPFERYAIRETVRRYSWDVVGPRLVRVYREMAGETAC